jgi:hypothetical protein
LRAYETIGTVTFGLAQQFDEVEAAKATPVTPPKDEDAETVFFENQAMRILPSVSFAGAPSEEGISRGFAIARVKPTLRAHYVPRRVECTTS